MGNGQINVPGGQDHRVQYAWYPGQLYLEGYAAVDEGELIELGKKDNIYDTQSTHSEKPRLPPSGIKSSEFGPPPKRDPKAPLPSPGSQRRSSETRASNGHSSRATQPPQAPARPVPQPRPTQPTRPTPAIPPRSSPQVPPRSEGQSPAPLPPRQTHSPQAKSPPPAYDSSSQSPQPDHGHGPSPQMMSELSNRFGKLGTPSPDSAQPANGPKKAPPPMARPKPAWLSKGTQSRDSGSSNNHASSPSPPAVPQSTKPQVNKSTKPKPQQQSGFSAYKGPKQARDIDLHLSNAWYASPTLSLPPTLASRNDMQCSMNKSAKGLAGRVDVTLNFEIRWIPDLSRSWIKVTYNESNPSGTSRCEQRHVERPPLLDKYSLAQAQRNYGRHVLGYAANNVGRKIGRGECWDLADYALKSVPDAMNSFLRVHGHPIYECSEGSTSGVWAADDTVRPGDILQFRSARFEKRENGKVVSRGTCGDPDHTSIARTYDPSTGTIEVYEQNSNGRRFVTEGSICLSDQCGGSLCVYRPVGKDWLDS